MKLKVGQIIQFSAIAVILAVVIVANCILLEPGLAQKITSIICPPMVSQEALAASRAEGQELSNDIVMEGSVLVKNNGALPLNYQEASAVNVFGHAAIDWVYGGSGSGQVIPESSSKPGDNVDFLEALDLYSVEYNTQLIDMYKRFAPAAGDIGSINTYYDAFYKLCEPSIDDAQYYSANLKSAAESFSDVAFVVIGRHAGETEDPTRVQYKNKANMKKDESRHYLEISTEEEALLKWVGEKFSTVVVIVNSTNAMELDFVDTIPGIDACLVVGATGTRGATAIPYLLYGEDNEGNPVSPSGHFVDTYAYDMSSNVNYKRTSAEGIGHYTNGQDLYPTNAGGNAGVGTRTAPAFIDYIEGIYLGYKWYETADVEGVWNNYERKILDAQDKEITVKGYDAVVQYPFGYGLSYTDFKWTVQSLSVSNNSSITAENKIVMEIYVENIGNYVGKEVVQVYLTPEYHEGEIEKSHVTLVGFAKTNDIAPGGNEVVTVELDAYDFTSYDAYDANENDFTGYELEEGKYEVKLMTDSHTVKTVDFLAGNKGVEGIITYNVESDIKLANDPVTGKPVTNKFTGDAAKDGASLDGSNSNQNIGYISRAAMPDPASISAVADREMSANVMEHNQYDTATRNAWDSAQTDIWGNAVHTAAVTWGASAGTLTAEDGTSYADSVGSDGKAKVYMNGQVTSLGFALGSDYNHPLWDEVLDQLTLSEAETLIYEASFFNKALNSIGKPALEDRDGPNQVRSFNGGNERGTGFPCTTVLAQTWNAKLAYSFGINYGKEMNVLSVDGVYGFGANLHRSAWGGRNYEYFSEDGFLSAEMLTEQVRALKNTGHYTYLKHLVLYETEHERDSMYTWCNEQALREIYLKPFRKSILEGGCVGIMTSYNRIGNVWTGGSEALITGILRNEWNFNGSIVTDYVDSWSQKYMSIEDAIRAGGDINLGGYTSALKSNFNTSATPRLQYQVREICHHVTYAFLSARYTNKNYNANEDVEQIVTGAVLESWEWWKMVLVDLDILAGVGCAFWAYMILRKAYFGKMIDGESAVEE